MRRNVYRYTVLNLDLNYAYEIETDRLYKVGQKIVSYDAADRRTYSMRVVRIEGTVYNKSAEQLMREKQERIAAIA